jgi:hypothetical protein
MTTEPKDTQAPMLGAPRLFRRCSIWSGFRSTWSSCFGDISVNGAQGPLTWGADQGLRLAGSRGRGPATMQQAPRGAWRTRRLPFIASGL